MLRNLFGVPLLCLALVVELAIVVALIDSDNPLVSATANLSSQMLISAHVAASLFAAICTSILLSKLVPGPKLRLIFFLFTLNVFIPFVGAVGSWLAISFGALMAQHRHKENVFWQFTNNTDLPFAAPIDRPHPKLDSRGFIEQLAFDSDTETLYNKVVASRHIRDSQSGPVLKSAVEHSNERIRLVAYQMLDKKINSLNREIQKLEKSAQTASGLSKANIHLQIANNYWELLTLEGDEPVAREQLLESASSHAQAAIELQPKNVNANFLLGQITLKQGYLSKATAAFEHAQRLGMPEEKVIPYLAETAFVARDFKKLRATIANMNPAFRAYPPFSNVAEFWA